MENSYQKQWRQNFPYPSFRKGQESACEAIAKRLDAGQKFTIAELPTGIGKSSVAAAIARSAPDSAYITTPQNILIDQYCSEFSGRPWFYLIKGKRHYKCLSRFSDCEAGIHGKCVFTKGEEVSCTYKVERDKARRSPVALTNASYFALACRQLDLWSKRSLAVIDEAHNLADEVMNLTSMEITDHSLQRMQVYRTIPTNLCQRPEVDLGDFRKYLQDLKKELMWTLDSLRDKAHVDGKLVDKMETVLQKINWFERSADLGVEWIVDYDLDAAKNDRLTARPVDTNYFAQDLFFKYQASQFVLQSATIVDFKRYAEELGVSDAFKVVRPSPFPVERSPVYPLDTGNMNYSNIGASLEKIADAVGRILDARPNQKGLVHTGSYKVQQYLKTIFAQDPRCLFPESGKNSLLTREAALDLHFSSPVPTVLFSPSMTEGVDGRGDFLRFQIICKLPYPSLADRRIKIKTDRSAEWYLYQTAKQLIQAKGRGMRSEDDWCETFVLDSGFWGFVKRAELPTDFMRCVRSKDDGWKAITSAKRIFG